MGAPITPTPMNPTLLILSPSAGNCLTVARSAAAATGRLWRGPGDVTGTGSAGL